MRSAAVDRMAVIAALPSIARPVPTRREVAGRAIGGLAVLIQLLSESTLGLDATFPGAEVLHDATGILLQALACWLLAHVARPGVAVAPLHDLEGRG